MKIEMWSPVVGFEKFYEVSNYGRVRTVPRTVRNKHGLIQIPRRFIKLFLTEKGYREVFLYRGGGMKLRKTRLVHRLVLEAFVGPKPEGTECCHGDGDRSNNFVGNLRWDTPKNNCADKKRHGTLAYGARAGNTKLTAEDIPKIRAMKSEVWGAMSRCAREFKVNAATIRDIWIGRTWTHVE
jgi:hypothetical protein